MASAACPMSKRQAAEEDAQSLPNWLFPHRYRREVRAEQGKLHMFVAIDRTSKFAFVEQEKATTAVSGSFLRNLLKGVPYNVHTVLTDNGVQFTTPGAGGSAVPSSRKRWRAQSFARMPSNTPAPKQSSIAPQSRSIPGPTARSSE